VVRKAGKKPNNFPRSRNRLREKAFERRIAGMDFSRG